MRKILYVVILCSLFILNGCKENSSSKLVVGTEGFMGIFLPTEGFLTSSSDQDVKELIHGGDLVTLNENGELQLDYSVLESCNKIEEDEEKVTYQIQLKKRFWSDQKAITSDDYIFALLLSASQEFVEIGGMDPMGETILGYYDYLGGESDTIKGISKVDDQTFQLSISQDSLPYYWELAYLNLRPYPMHALIQDGEYIESTEEGSKFHGDMKRVVSTFYTDYNKTQNPSCGPYTLKAFKNGVVQLKKNEFYSGDQHGNYPMIEEIVLKEVNYDTAFHLLEQGEIHLLDFVMDHNQIEDGKSKENLQFVSYPRNGYGMLLMKANKAPTDDVHVRRAIGYLINREEIVNELLGKDGYLVDSDYIHSQWMFQKTPSLDLKYKYGLSLEKAIQELDASSYRFEADGKTLYDATKAMDGYYRYNEKQEKLTIKHAIMDNGIQNEILLSQLKSNCSKVGIDYAVELVEEATLYDAYYEEEKQDYPYQLLSMGSEFASINDPYYALGCEFQNTSSNGNKFCDKKMDEILLNLRHTKPEDTEEFLKH